MGFSFQGIHSKEKKLKARITGYPMLPAFRNNTESIPGRSGMKSTKGIFICRSIIHLKTKETIQGKTTGKCRVITFRRTTSQL